MKRFLVMLLAMLMMFTMVGFAEEAEVVEAEAPAEVVETAAEEFVFRNLVTWNSTKAEVYEKFADIGLADDENAFRADNELLEERISRAWSKEIEVAGENAHLEVLFWDEKPMAFAYQLYNDRAYNSVMQGLSLKYGEATEKKADEFLADMTCVEVVSPDDVEDYVGWIVGDTRISVYNETLATYVFYTSLQRMDDVITEFETAMADAAAAADKAIYDEMTQGL